MKDILIHPAPDDADADDDDKPAPLGADMRRHWHYDFVVNAGRPSQRPHADWKLRLDGDRPG
jgi:hypothetical protein